MQLSYVEKFWSDLQASPALAKKMEDIAAGKIKHAGPIMTQIWKRVYANGASAAAEKGAEP